MNSSPLSPTYRLDAATQVWCRPEFVSIPYSDGADIEKQIAEIIRQASDLSVLSPELAGQCSSWPTLYHLSGSRANLLRPFERELKQADVLEIGAGCGALTRFLGEAGAHVLALEGSLTRAAIARARCRDLANITVLAEDFKAFETSARFDIVTLIGVLEYAPLFFPGEDPVCAMLQRIGMFLKPGGRLILAIENKLGLKYFAGAPEDHLGISMYGIENRYKKNEPHTFGKTELRSLLEQAGFVGLEFMFPFPDYKFPTTIITESGLACRGFDSGALIRQTAMQDTQLPDTLVFSPLLAWPSITQNGLVDELSNSFLVQACLGSPIQPERPAPLAWHYATRRATAYCKETTFIVESQTQAIAVHSRSLAEHAAAPQGSEIIKWQPAPVTKYLHGHLLSDDFIACLSQNGWRVESLSTLFKRYLDMLTEAAVANGQSVSLHSLDTQLPGSMWDLTPQNIIIDSAGNWHALSQEWRIKEPITFGGLIIHSLLDLLQSIVQTGRCADDGIVTRADLILATCQAVGLETSREELESYLERERAIQTLISCSMANPPQSVAAILGEPLTRRSILESLSDRQRERAAAATALAEKDAQLSRLNSQIAAIRNSLSWKLTWPLRMVRLKF